MQNLKHLEYTFIHRHALVFVIQKIIKDKSLKIRLLERAKWHDLDKAFLYTIIAKKDASAYHRLDAAHHLSKQAEDWYKRNDVDLLEAICDWECAGYTKADKPLNAYDTLRTYDNYTHRKELFAHMKELGIDHSYRNTPDDEDWQEFLKTMPPITETYILQEIYKWMIEFPVIAERCLKYAQAMQLAEKAGEKHQ